MALRLRLSPTWFPPLLLVACQGPGPGSVTVTSEPEPAPEPAPLEALVEIEAVQAPVGPIAAAREAMDEGDYRQAREHLAEALVIELSAEAAELVSAGRALTALTVLDEALDLGEGNPAILHQRGLAALAAAPDSSSPQFLYEDAVEHLVAAIRAKAPVGAYFDASRAARRIPDPDKALALARRGAEVLAELDPHPTIDPLPERTWAEAAFDVFIDRLNDPATKEEAAEFYLEAQDQFSKLLGRTPEDTWPRLQLANLYQWAGDNEAAIAQLRLALEVAPTDQAIHDRLQQLAVPQQGYPALLEFYRQFAAARPDARVLRNLGVVSFHTALEAFEAGDYDAGAYDEAEDMFRRARHMDPALQSDCLGFEAITRNARGWSHYRAGDLRLAKEAFLSMEDLFAGALAWSLPPRLPDGVSSLGWVVGELTANPNTLEALPDMLEAASITDTLHAYRPLDGNLANNAGFVNRDTAVLLMFASRANRRRAQELEGDEAQALLREADELRVQAVEVMQRSWSAYQEAARLLPADVRVVNDAGLVMTYYLRSDPEAAEVLLLSAIEHGAEQVPAGGLEAEDQALLEEAWGDAHQNMAILELTLRNNPTAARDWLTKSLEIGPASREQLRPLLADCERMIAGEDVNLAETLAGRMVWLDN